MNALARFFAGLLAFVSGFVSVTTRSMSDNSLIESMLHQLGFISMALGVYIWTTIRTQPVRAPGTPHPNTHVLCPDCREFVRDDATVCSHCGCKLTPKTKLQTNSAGIENQPAMDKAAWKRVAWVVGVIGVLVMLYENRYFLDAFFRYGF